MCRPTALFTLLLLYGVVTALRSRSQYGRLLAATLTANLFFYVVVNIAMNMGLLPVVGMPLPFPFLLALGLRERVVALLERLDLVL